eukprot:4694569-Pyramimonas_sp.AAC.1
MAARAAAASVFIEASRRSEEARQLADPHGEGLREHLLSRWGEGKVTAQDVWEAGEGGSYIPSLSHVIFPVGVGSIDR